MAQLWPAQLQDYLNEDSFRYAFGNTVIKTEMEVGPPKRRRRSTEAIDSISCTIDMEYDDISILKNFYDTTLNGGVDSFEFTDPFTLTTKEYKFDGPPQVRPIGGRWFRVSMVWEVQL